MPRPKPTDPTVPVTVRIKRSQLKWYDDQAEGSNFTNGRTMIEGLVRARADKGLGIVSDTNPTKEK